MSENAAHPDWAHIFINVTCPLSIGEVDEEMRVALALRAAAASVTARQISRLRHTAVAQWEVRL